MLRNNKQVRQNLNQVHLQGVADRCRSAIGAIGTLDIPITFPGVLILVETIAKLESTVAFLEELGMDPADHKLD